MQVSGRLAGVERAHAVVELVRQRRLVKSARQGAHDARQRQVQEHDALQGAPGLAGCRLCAGSGREPPQQLVVRQRILIRAPALRRLLVRIQIAHAMRQLRNLRHGIEHAGRNQARRLGRHHLHVDDHGIDLMLVAPGPAKRPVGVVHHRQRRERGAGGDGGRHLHERPGPVRRHRLAQVHDAPAAHGDHDVATCGDGCIGKLPRRLIRCRAVAHRFGKRNARGSKRGLRARPGNPHAVRPGDEKRALAQASHFGAQHIERGVLLDVAAGAGLVRDVDEFVSSHFSP